MAAPAENELNALIRELELIYSMKDFVPMSGPSEADYSTKTCPPKPILTNKHASAKAELPACNKNIDMGGV